MKLHEHVRFTWAAYGPVTGILAVLPDIGVAMQRLPGMRLKRWGAILHHDARTVGFLQPFPWLGSAWAAHCAQDIISHPPGTYGTPEKASVPASTVLAYSGGPDAFITWRLLGQPTGIYLDVGNESAPAEKKLALQAAEKFDGTIAVINGGYAMHEMGTGWIPYRNLRIILACAEYSPNVALARIAEWGPDKNPAFFRRVERLLASSRGGHFQAAADLPKVRIWTPVGHLTKTQLVRRYINEFGYSARDDLTEYTRSCYSGGELFCGECGGCWCRWVAFTRNGIDESDRYAKKPQRLDYYRRLDWRDFRPSMVPMYVKRAWEMRGME